MVKQRLRYGLTTKRYLEACSRTGVQADGLIAKLKCDRIVMAVANLKMERGRAPKSTRGGSALMRLLTTKEGRY